MKSSPEVSVIMPAYNASPTIERAIRALQQQSASNFEVVVVDDGSTDNTKRIVSRAAESDSRIRLIALDRNVGVGMARRIAIDACAGEWITALDADDWCKPQRLEMMLSAGRELYADMVLDNLLIFDHALDRIVDRTRYGSASRPTRLTATRVFELDHAMSRHPIGFAKPMFKTAFLRTHNLNYDARFRCGEDFALLSDVVLKGGRTFVVPGAFYVYVQRISPSARTASPFSRADTGIGHADMFQGCDRTLAVHGAAMTTQIRRAVARRKQSLEDFVLYMEYKEALAAKQYAKAMSYLRRRPVIALFKAVTSWNRIHTLARVWQSGRRSNVHASDIMALK
jgi:succinoglycan biosynthesis protein ExoO